MAYTETNHFSEVDDLPETPLIPPAATEPAVAVETAEAPMWPTLADYLPAFYEQMGSQGEGLKTYFSEFDQALEGLRGIVILGGEPGSGKTALAMQIGFDTADQDQRPVLIYSFEMPKAQLVTRLFQRAGQIRYKKMQHKAEDLLGDDRQRLEEAKAKVSQAATRLVIRETKDFFEVTDSGIEAHFNFAEQIEQIDRLTRQYGKPPLVIIDSLHEIPLDSKLFRSAELKQKIDHIMLNLRNMCDRTGATFLLISHQSRSGQEGGGLRSFLGSASIEYTVDMALTVSMPKDEKGKTDPTREHERELLVNKNRYGPKPKALLDFEGQYMDFTFVNLL